MRVAAVQFRAGRKVPENIATAEEWIAKAASEQADILVLPEFFNTVYFPQYRDKAYFALAEPETGPSLQAIRSAAARCRINVVATLYESVAPGLYFDTAFLVGRKGEVIGKYRKLHPAAVNSLEKLYFRPGDGLPVWKVDGWKVGICICYDLMLPETARCLTLNGAELLLVPYATNRKRMWSEMLRTRAFENGVYLVAANKCGREGEWDFAGHSAVIDPLGSVLVQAGDQDPEMITAPISRDVVVRARIDYPTLRDRRPERYGAICSVVERLSDRAASCTAGSAALYPGEVENNCDGESQRRSR